MSSNGRGLTVKTAFRYFYQPAKEQDGCWMYLGAALNTRAGADRLVAEFNRRDRGKWRWRCALVLPTDFDHPLRTRK